MSRNFSFMLAVVKDGMPVAVSADRRESRLGEDFDLLPVHKPLGGVAYFVLRSFVVRDRVLEIHDEPRQIIFV